MHLTAEFHCPKFSRSKVTVRTNKHTDKQTPLKTSTSLRYATPVSNQSECAGCRQQGHAHSETCCLSSVLEHNGYGSEMTR